MHFALYGKPITKKNSGRILRGKNGTPFVAPSAAYKRYEDECLAQIYAAGLHRLRMDGRYNVQAVYYMPDRRRVDLTNLLSATDDILVRGCVLLDDHSGIVAGHDGSRVQIDARNPRVEITITELPRWSE